MNDPLEKDKQPTLAETAARADIAVSVKAAAPSDSSPWVALKLLVNPTWLRNTGKVCLAFAPDCIFPSALMTAGGLVVIIGWFSLLGQLKVEVVQLPNLFAALGIALAMMALFLGLVIWSFAVWLVRLSTFSHAFYQLDAVAGRLKTEEGPGEELSPSVLRSLFASSHSLVLARKKYLARFYFLVSMIAAPPLIVWMILVFIKVYSMEPPTTLLIRLVLPPAVDVCLMSLIALIGAYLTGLSCVALVVSSVSKQGANVAAWDCIKLSFSNMIPLILVAAVVGILNCAVTSPQFFLNPSSSMTLGVTASSLPGIIAAQLWQGLSNLVLLTFSVSPFCELVRNKVK